MGIYALVVPLERLNGDLASADSMVAPPTVLAGRYEVGRVIGQGGMAVVHAGHDRRLDRPVAIKLLRLELAHQLAVRRRFESEAHLAARLAHPNVVSVLDSGEEDGLAFMVMERLSGRTLHDQLATGPLSGPAVQELAVQMLAALATAHGAGVVHRDIKPGNILAGAAGEWKLGDFGIAKAVELPSGDQTATGLVIGTPAYLAPERFFGGDATVKSDLYALGVVMYEALAGRKPFDAATPQAWASTVVAAAPSPLRALRRDVDPALAEAIDRCLAKDPDQRYGSAAEMATAISGPASWGDVAPAVARTDRPEPTRVLPVTEMPSQPGWAGAVMGLGGRRLFRALAAGAAVLIVAAVVLFSAIGHPARSTPQPSPSTSLATTPASGSLPSGLDQALQRLQRQVRH